jgi:hypothetical protein
MATTRLTTIFPGSLMLCIAALSVSQDVLAEQDVISDDGREVLLRDDGSWVFLSTDRYANTADGRRVRLKADGSWEYVGNAPMQSEQQVRTTTTDVRLQKVEIENHEEKSFKNVRVTSQTVFYLDINVSPLAEKAITISDADLPRIQVQDDKGKTYPVLSVSPNPLTLKPDSKQTIEIRADGAPSWLRGVKSMQIELPTGMMGNGTPIRLEERVDDMEKKKVDAFEKN